MTNLSALRPTAAIQIRPVPNMEGYGQFMIRMIVSEAIARKASEVLMRREGPFIYPEDHSDEFCDGILNVWSDVRGCAHRVSVGNVIDEPTEAFFITVLVDASRDGDDALDGTLGYPSEPSATDLADVAWVMRELLLRAAK